MTDDRHIPAQQRAPSNEQVAELLGLTTEEVKTYRLETTREGNTWRIYLGREILSSKRVASPTEKVPARLVVEIAVDE